MREGALILISFPVTFCWLEEPEKRAIQNASAPKFVDAVQPNSLNTPYLNNFSFKLTISDLICISSYHYTACVTV